MHLRRPEMPGLSLRSIFHLVTSVQPRWFVGDGTNCSCHPSGVTRRLTSEQRMMPSTVRRYDFPQIRSDFADVVDDPKLLLRVSGGR